MDDDAVEPVPGEDGADEQAGHGADEQRAAGGRRAGRRQVGLASPRLRQPRSMSRYTTTGKGERGER